MARRAAEASGALLVHEEVPWTRCSSSWWHWQPLPSQLWPRLRLPLTSST